MKEAGVVLDANGEPIHWHLPPDRSTGYIPDSRDLWDVFWENRKNLSGFAHSHPGGGIPGPSTTDLTTFAAVESGLGRRLSWYIASSDALVVCRWQGPERLAYVIFICCRSSDYDWLKRLREVSYDPEKAVFQQQPE
jgi:hypothetical protein